MATTLPPGSSDAERFLDERLEQQLVETGLSAQAAGAIRNALQFVIMRLLFVLASKEEMTHAIDGLRREVAVGFESARRETDAKIEGLRNEMNAKFDGLRKEMNAKFDGLRDEMNAKFDGLRDEMNAKFDAQRREMRAMFGILASLMIALIILVLTRSA